MKIRLLFIALSLTLAMVFVYIENQCKVPYDDKTAQTRLEEVYLSCIRLGFPHRHCASLLYWEVNRMIKANEEACKEITK